MALSFNCFGPNILISLKFLTRRWRKPKNVQIRRYLSSIHEKDDTCSVALVGSHSLVQVVDHHANLIALKFD